MFVTVRAGSAAATAATGGARPHCRCGRTPQPPAARMIRGNVPATGTISLRTLIPFCAGCTTCIRRAFGCQTPLLISVSAVERTRDPSAVEQSVSTPAIGRWGRAPGVSAPRLARGQAEGLDHPAGPFEDQRPARGVAGGRAPTWWSGTCASTGHRPAGTDVAEGPCRGCGEPWPCAGIKNAWALLP